MAINERDINIHLRLFDNFSSAAARIQTSTQRLSQNLEQAGRAASQFGGRLAFLGGATTGAFLVAMKNIEGASPAVTRTFRELENVMRNFQLSVAESAQPALQRMVDIFAALVDAWSGLDPAMRDAIVQFTFTAGAALLAAGALLKFGGAIATIVGKIGGIVAGLEKKHVVIALISAGLAAMIANWDRVRQFVLPIVNNLAIAADFLAIAWLKMADAVLAAFEKLASILPKRFSGIKDGIEDARRALLKLQISISDDLKKAVATGDSAAATALDNMVQKVKTTTDAFVTLGSSMSENLKRGTSKAKQEVQNFAAYSERIVRDLARSMESNLGNFFYNTLKGQVNAGKQFFIDFGNSVLQILTQALAKLVLFHTVGKALGSTLGFNPFSFHSGGVVRKAHSGTLAQEEVPIIAQEGEGILSRQGVASLGRSNLSRLNRGEDLNGGGARSGPVIVIQAWDAQDIQRNSKQIENIIASAIKKNAPLRGVIKQHG